MGKLRDEIEMDMRLRRFSHKTIACYLACMKDVAKHFRKSPAELGDEEIRAYLHYLMEERRASQSVLVQTYSALKFFLRTRSRSSGTLSGFPVASRGGNFLEY